MDHRLIKNIHKSLGSAAVTKVFIYMEQLFKENPQGFFKFHYPCKHPNYKDGTSMAEETQSILPTLNYRLHKVCALYKSKGLYVEAIDELGADAVFQNKPYLRYADHSVHQNYFIRNARIAENIMRGFPISRTYCAPNDEWVQNTSQIFSLCR